MQRNEKNIIYVKETRKGDASKNRYPNEHGGVNIEKDRPPAGNGQIRVPTMKQRGDVLDT